MENTRIRHGPLAGTGMYRGPRALVPVMTGQYYLRHSFLALDRDVTTTEPQH